MGRIAVVGMVMVMWMGLETTSFLSHTRVEGWASTFARGLAIAHSYALQAAAADPTMVGPVTIPVAGVLSGISVQACKNATTVATWLVPGSFSYELPIAAHLIRLSFRDPGAGTSSAGMVTADPGRIVSLPCAVPENVPVMATVFRN